MHPPLAATGTQHTFVGWSARIQPGCLRPTSGTLAHLLGTVGVGSEILPNAALGENVGPQQIVSTTERFETKRQHLRYPGTPGWPLATVACDTVRPRPSRTQTHQRRDYQVTMFSVGNDGDSKTLAQGTTWEVFGHTGSCLRAQGLHALSTASVVEETKPCCVAFNSA